MFHGLLDYIQKPPLGGISNTKPGDYGTPNTHNRWFILFYHVWVPTWIEIHWIAFGWRPSHIRLHTTLEGPWPHYMILEATWDGLWTLSFGLSKFHGHGSWLVCEVALIVRVALHNTRTKCRDHENLKGPWKSSKGRTEDNRNPIFYWWVQLRRCAKSHDHEIVRAQKKVSKGRPTHF